MRWALKATGVCGSDLLPRHSAAVRSCFWIFGRRGRSSIGRNCGFINRSGKFVIPPQYDFASQFSDGLGRVRLDIANGKEMTVEG